MLPSRSVEVKDVLDGGEEREVPDRHTGFFTHLTQDGVPMRLAKFNRVNPLRRRVRVMIGSAQPRRIQPLPLGQWRAGRHHATGSDQDEVTTSRVRTEPCQRSDGAQYGASQSTV